MPKLSNEQEQPPEVFHKKGILKNVPKFAEKRLWQSFMFNKVLGGAYNFIKKETLAQVFSCEFWEIFKSTFFTEHLRETAAEWEIFLVPLTHFVLKFPFKVSARFKMKSLRQNFLCVNDTINP